MHLRAYQEKIWGRKRYVACGKDLHWHLFKYLVECVIKNCCASFYFVITERRTKIYKWKLLGAGFGLNRGKDF